MKGQNTRTVKINPVCAIGPLPAQPESRAMIKTADVVVSLNGRDEGKLFMVVGSEDGYLLLADGKGRKIEKPKRKKNKHLKLEERADNPIAAKLIAGEKVTNNEIRRALAQFATARGEKGGM